MWASWVWRKYGLVWGLSLYPNGNFDLFCVLLLTAYILVPVVDLRSV